MTQHGARTVRRDVGHCDFAPVPGAPARIETMGKLHEIQGYHVVLSKIAHVTRVFEAARDEGAQFNVMLDGGSRLQFKYPDRPQATLARDLLIQALEAA